MRVSRGRADEGVAGRSARGMFLIARPEGMMQWRGTCLPLWDDVLPKVPEEVWREANCRITKAMEAGGGTGHL
ncbi:hypothetical protein [Streptomyces sp. NPDC059909]|uniref:hypothetical protein n=1 Tax=Streptomyces sp. NPDC059909 TaxID=3346998 RepID=UPI00364ED945